MLARRAVAEVVGTTFLLIAVVGSGIAAERLSSDVGLQLLVNALVSGAALAAIILAVGPVSGAHLNPVVTLVDWVFGGLDGRRAVTYVAAQVSGGVVGTVIANLMFSLPAVELSTRSRSSAGLWVGEVVATFGLCLVIFGVVRSGRPTAAPIAVGAYVFAAVLFTSSTSFANPAVTVARALTDTFTGIAPASLSSFLLAQLAGGAMAVVVIRALYPAMTEVADDVVLPRQAVQDGEDVKS